jgi:hypothetical protein
MFQTNVLNIGEDSLQIEIGGTKYLFNLDASTKQLQTIQVRAACFATTGSYFHNLIRFLFVMFRK